jgi:hypothetical protein
MNWRDDPKIPGLPPREFLWLASYCGEDDLECSEGRPCSECLAMCNIFGEDGNYIRELGEPRAIAQTKSVNP